MPRAEQVSTGQEWWASAPLNLSIRAEPVTGKAVGRILDTSTASWALRCGPCASQLLCLTQRPHLHAHTCTHVYARVLHNCAHRPALQEEAEV